MRVIMLSDERIRQIAMEYWSGTFGTRVPDMEKAIRAAITEQAEAYEQRIRELEAQSAAAWKRVLSDKHGIEVYASNDNPGCFGFTGCESDDFESEYEAIQAAVDEQAEAFKGELQAYNATLREKAAMADEAHDVLRTLACELGAGGYNAEIVDASVFEHKIRDGVNMLLNPLMNRVSQAEQERDDLRKDAERYRWLRDGEKSAGTGMTDEAIDAHIAKERQP